MFMSVRSKKNLWLAVEALEERNLLSWGGAPPASIVTPTTPAAVILNTQGDAAAQATIASNEVDWFKFTAPTNGSYTVFVEGKTPRFDSVMGLYQTTGKLFGGNNDMAPGNHNSRMTFVLKAGTTYLVGITNYVGTPAGTYAWSINGPSAPSTPPVNPPLPENVKGHTLFINFDGVDLTRADLLRYSRNGLDWDTNRYDAERDGIRVQPFIADRSDREQVINRILDLVRNDLRPFNLTVQRTLGKAVEGQGATTIFMGMDSINGRFAGIASGVDLGNDDVTDIAFVRNYYPTNPLESLAASMADLVIHEAGHTWGLQHVDAPEAGEAMGTFYTGSNQTFMNRSFTTLGALGGYATQNSYQVLYQTFVQNNPPRPVAAAAPSANSMAALSSLFAHTGDECQCLACTSGAAAPRIAVSPGRLVANSHR